MLPADARSPSGGTLPLDAFLDEWISAPYPPQQQDRALIMPGLAWLDAETRRRFGLDFVAAGDAQRRAVTWAGVNLCDVKSVTLNRDAAAGAWVDYDH